MKRLSCLVLLLCLVAAGQSQANPQDKPAKFYQNEKFSFRITIPEGWKFSPDEANAYFALYSPEVAEQKHSRDLVSGLKIEILPQTNEELEEFLSRNDLTPINEKPNQYYFRDAACYYLVTVIKGSSWSFLLIGYFPEKQKEAKYVPLYQQVIESFIIL